ncbi:sodium/hydrogen exchanger 9B1 isoform X7 [Mirounga angustirostris]|uniref:sodium/hydrogen exchanger 9B1 isoform X7 n=1 Tax=Mirounga angustirostris TaxID=9716 RepID=UPI00313D87D0
MILKYLTKPQSESSIFGELRLGHKFCCMYTTESQNEHLEDKNTSSSTTPQILKDSSISEHEETKETVLSQTEETKPQMEKTYSCPPQGKLNKLITNGINASLREVQIKTTMRYYLTPVRMAKINNTQETRGVDEEAEKGESSCTVDGNAKLVHPLWKTVWRFLKKLKIELLYDPAITILGVAFFMAWCVVWSFSGPEVLPGGNLFGLLIIFYSAIIGGKLLELIRIPSVPQLPPLLGGILNNVLASFRDVLIGALAGAVLGIFVQYFPSGDQTKLPLKRAFLILSMCVTAVLGSHHIGLHAAGGLCTLALTFVAGINWSTEKVKVQRIIKTTWYIFQPLLFGLVGSEVSVASLQSNAIGICVATMSLALLVRISFTFLLMCFAGFSFKEKIFIALSWMPKATVQAVLGPLALETARSSAPHLEPYSKDVMTVAFLAILITAPNGALIIGILGPKVLTRHDPNKVDVELTKLELH